jgi:hypothetical protein
MRAMSLAEHIAVIVPFFVVVPLFADFFLHRELPGHPERVASVDLLFESGRCWLQPEPF